MNKHENFNLYGKRQATEANGEMTQMLESSEKYFKAASMKIPKIPNE